MCLILVKELVPESRRFSVEGNGVVGRLEFIQCLEQHLGEAVNGIDHFAGFPDRERWQGVVGTMNQGVTVKQHQQGFFHTV